MFEAVVLLLEFVKHCDVDSSYPLYLTEVDASLLP